MKKLLIISLLAVSTQAFAVGASLKSTSSFNGGSPSRVSTLTIFEVTRYGGVDVRLGHIERGQLSANGFELGYGVPIKLGKLSLLPRIAYGRVNQNINPAWRPSSPAQGKRPPGLHDAYVATSLDVKYEISDVFGLVASYNRYANAQRGSLIPAYTLSGGLEVAPTKWMALGIGYQTLTTNSGFGESGPYVSWNLRF